MYVRCSVQDGNLLYLNGNSDWRNLNRNTVKSNWNRNYLVGKYTVDTHGKDFAIQRVPAPPVALTGDF